MLMVVHNHSQKRVGIPIWKVIETCQKNHYI